MALDLGELFATVDIVDAPFQRKYTKLIGQLEQLGVRAAKSAEATVSLDDAYVGLGRAATPAATGIAKTATAARAAADAEIKAAVAAQGHADALARVSTVAVPSVATTSRLQAAQLRQLAAQENVNRAMMSGTTTTRQLATAQAGLISASRAVANAQVTAMAKWEAASARAAAVGKSLTHTITLPVIAAAAAGVYEAVKFQKSMTLIQTAGGETEAKSKAIAAGIKAIATATGTSLGDLSEGIYTVAKAGSTKWSATDQLLILKAAAQGAKAENVDLGTATNALTSVMMSYHLGASQAVAVQNELIVGAGKAKTTMQEYAGALSTVVPVASAANISFDQIAGAIATLTQHGTSAKEATQELAFTIRNLQAPNSVAIAAMNQLGIASVDVSKNLGKRGLTGTLEFIESKLPKTGLVYLDTMKHMEAGTADLNTMMSKMPASLQKLSQGFLNGSVSAKDYRTAFKNLGADGYSEGAAFLSLAAKVNGYSDAVRNGTPAQKTMAAELKQIFGGAVGLNTALQLGGENMAYFKTATDAVGAAARKSGVDVLGWSKTQDTLAVKLDKAKANLQVLAVEVGTALIPAVTKMVSGVMRAVTWFEHLSSEWKKTIGVSALVLAALGPVIAILARVSKTVLAVVKIFTLFGRGAIAATRSVLRAFGLMATAAQASAVATATAAAEAAQAEADKAVATAAAAARIAASDEEMSASGRLAAEQAAANAEVFAAAKRAEALAAQEAADAVAAAAEEERAASMSAFGAISIAIGGVVAIGYGLSQFMSDPHGGNWGMPRSMAKAIDEATQQSKNDLAEWKASVASIGDAWDQDRYKLGLYTRAQIATSLSKQTAYDPYSGAKTNVLGNASTLGLNLDLVVNAQVDPASKTKLAKQIADIQRSAQTELAALNKVKNKYGVLAVNVTGSPEQKLGFALQNQITGLQELSKALGISSSAITVQVKKADLLAVAHGKLPYVVRAAALQFSLYGASLDKYTAEGAQNIEFIKEHVQALDKQKRGVEAGTLSLYNQLTALGYNTLAVLRNIEAYGKVPQKVFTKAYLDSKTAEDKAAVLQMEIDAIKQHKVPGVDASTKKGHDLILALQNQITALKQYHVPTVSVHTDGAVSGLDAVLNRLFKIGNTSVTPKVNMPNLPILSGGLLPGHATGGLITGPGTGTSDSIATRLSKGEFVENAAATSKFKPLLQAINSGAVSSIRELANFAPVAPTMPATRAGSAAAPIPAVYVQNPFTGEYLLAQVAHVADDRSAARARRVARLSWDT